MASRKSNVNGRALAIVVAVLLFLQAGLGAGIVVGVSDAATGADREPGAHLHHVATAHAHGHHHHHHDDYHQHHDHDHDADDHDRPAQPLPPDAPCCVDHDHACLAGIAVLPSGPQATVVLAERVWKDGLATAPRMQARSIRGPPAVPPPRPPPGLAMLRQTILLI